MKPLLRILNLMLLTLSCQAYAAKTDLDDISDSFADNYTFSIPLNIGTSSQVQTFMISIGQVRDFAALLDGMDLKLMGKSGNKGKGSDKRVEAIVSNFSVLSRSMIISGEVNDSLGASQAASGNSIQPFNQPPIVSQMPAPPTSQPALSSIPVPGAIWLLGSALLGMVGAKRRRVG